MIRFVIQLQRSCVLPKINDASAAEIKEDSEMAPTEADVTEEDDGIHMIFLSFFFFKSH